MLYVGGGGGGGPTSINFGPSFISSFIDDLPIIIYYVLNVNSELYADNATLCDIKNSVEDIENNLQILWTV